MVEVVLPHEMSLLAHDRALNQFLYYGYVMSERPELPIDMQQDGMCRDRTVEHRAFPDALVSEGVEVLATACGATLNSQRHASVHVVPISGGMDSRAILGGLLKNVDSSHIQTVTFGTPGTLDFQIGKSVARAAGVAHTEIDLSAVSWDGETLIRFAGQCERSLAVFEPYLFHQVRVRFGCECVYWIGFMGDPLSGSHLLDQDSRTWDQARHRFGERNPYCRSTVLVPPGFDATEGLPSAPFVDPGQLCYDEQLDFAVRQGCYIRPIVLLRGYHYRTPFLHPVWTRFILGVPRRYRQGQYLYKEILKAAYPRLFALPVKNNLGLPLTAPRWRRSLRRQRLRLRAGAKRFAPWIDSGISPGTNYIDFDRGLRERADLKAVVYESIQDLKKRRIVDWIDIDAIWDRHQKRRGNHADALILLASLEINLKAPKMRPK